MCEAGKPVVKGWQPIKTAPKDGTAIIARTSQEEVFACNWFESEGSWLVYGTDEVRPREWMPMPDASALPTPADREPVAWESPEEWEIEQRAFQAKMRSDVPVDVQQLVAKLWAMYCHAAAPVADSEPVSVPEGECGPLARAAQKRMEENGFLQAFGFDEILKEQSRVPTLRPAPQPNPKGNDNE